MTVYSNTTPLLAFSAIGRFSLLHQVHGEVRIVPSVVEECMAGGIVEVPDLRNVEWIQIQPTPCAMDELRSA